MPAPEPETLQRGHTSPGNLVRSQTSENSFTTFGLAADPASPVCRLNMPVSCGSWYRLMTQTGTPVVRSGRGAPKVRPLTTGLVAVGVPSLVVPVPVQWKFVFPSQPVRQYVSFEPPMTGKLCDVPVQPLSRSLPLPWVGSVATGVVRVICAGAVGSSARTGHDPTPGGRHCTMSLLVKPLAFISKATFLDGLYFLSGLVVFLGTRLRGRDRTTPEQQVPVAGTTRPAFFAGPLNLSDVIAPGVQLPAATPAQALRSIMQTPFGWPSASQVESPSLHASIDAVPLGLTDAVPVSHMAEQLPPLPGTWAACACDTSAVASAMAVSELSRENFMRASYIGAPLARQGAGIDWSAVERSVTDEIFVTGISSSRQQEPDAMWHVRGPIASQSRGAVRQRGVERHSCVARSRARSRGRGRLDVPARCPLTPRACAGSSLDRPSG